MGEALLDFENDSGENLHICPTPDRRLYVATHDGTEGGHYEASREDVVELVGALDRWLRWEADRASGEPLADWERELICRRCGASGCKCDVAAR